MTCEQILPDRWRLTFAEAEGAFIVNVLERLRGHYQEDPEQWAPGLRDFWRGSISAGPEPRSADLEEAQELLAEGRTELRSERLALADNWIRDFELADRRQPWQVEISGDERDEFVAMLNDRRLTLALELGISDAEMEGDPARIVDESRRSAVLEIDVLGHFMLVTLGPQIHRP
jgi:hypothetical protein